MPNENGGIYKLLFEKLFSPKGKNGQKIYTRNKSNVFDDDLVQCLQFGGFVIDGYRLRYFVLVFNAFGSSSLSDFPFLLLHGNFFLGLDDLFRSRLHYFLHGCRCGFRDERLGDFLGEWWGKLLDDSLGDLLDNRLRNLLHDRLGHLFGEGLADLLNERLMHFFFFRGGFGALGRRGGATTTKEDDEDDDETQDDRRRNEEEGDFHCYGGDERGGEG